MDLAHGMIRLKLRYSPVRSPANGRVFEYADGLELDDGLKVWLYISCVYECFSRKRSFTHATKQGTQHDGDFSPGH